MVGRVPTRLAPNSWLSQSAELNNLCNSYTKLQFLFYQATSQIYVAPAVCFVRFNFVHTSYVCKTEAFLLS